MAEVILRAVEPEDVDFMLECESDAANARWSSYKVPLSKSQLTTYALTYDADPFSAGQLRLIICAPEPVCKLVGILDLYDISAIDSRAFVGICIHPDFRRRGFAKAALLQLQVLNADRLGLANLFAEVSSLNKAGLALFESAGFSRVALLPQWHKIGSSFHDFILFHI